MVGGAGRGLAARAGGHVIHVAPVTRRSVQVDSRGELSGDQLMYIYPDLATVLCGSFSRGVMQDARATTVQDIGGWIVDSLALSHLKNLLKHSYMGV